MSRELDSQADYVEASKKAEHTLEKGERSDNCQSTRPPYGSRHDAVISVLLHTLHRMWRCLLAILILDELTARPIGRGAYLVPRCRAFQ